jgi:lysyl-tRNA synthetase class 2
MSDALRHERLRRRAEMLVRLRAFFAERRFLEVETPLLDDEVIPELHIEPFQLGDCPLFLLDREGAGDGSPQEKGTVPLSVTQQQENGPVPFFLQASPELHMKRLLAEGLPAIYQVTRSFRRGERGALHNPEFTIVEWYRAGDAMDAGVRLLDELCQHVADAAPASRTTYAEAFQRHAGVDPHRASCGDLADAASRLGVAVPEGLDRANRDEWLNLLLATRVEPQLGAAGPEILLDYPASQAALATKIARPNGVEVAERFELYWRGIELANGYHELTDGAALRTRLEEVNRQRAADNRPALPLPERLLQAMKYPGLPPCSGCALGFDRLVMLACGATTIDEVMAFTLPHP